MAVIGFKDSQASIDHLTLWHYDDIVAGRELIATKNLAYQSLGAISDNGAPEFPSDGNSQASNVALVGQGEQGRVAPGYPGALFVDLLELCPSADPFVAPKSSHVNLRC